MKAKTYKKYKGRQRAPEKKHARPPRDAEPGQIDKNTIRINYMVQSQKSFFSEGLTRDPAFRVRQLKKLKKAVIENEEKILAALKKDLNKAPFEAFTAELALFYQELNYSVRKLKTWNRPERVPTPWFLKPGRSYIEKEPYGNVLIIGPWNYPFQLVMVPLVSAIAAGNTAVVKPSENAPHTSKVIKNIISSVFEERYVFCAEGGVEVTSHLLKENFDYIFFTGGTSIGKIVMEAASKNLTPVTLELGGKSPAIVEADADIENAARKIAWGKFINAGQTCIAPDYVMVHSSVKNKLTEKIAEYTEEFFGKDPAESENYSRIINEKHFDRLIELLKGHRLFHGGQHNRSERFIAPTIVEVGKLKDPIMEDEIFGPILPVVEFSDSGEAVSRAKRSPNPLALYIFTGSSKKADYYKEKIPSGGVVINDVIVHVANHYLPFGGRGASGIGSYHGKQGFDTFTHRKSVFKRTFKHDFLFRYPPYRFPLNILRKLFR